MPETQTERHGCAATPSPWTAKPTTLPDVVEVRDSEGRQLASCYAVEYTNLRPVTVEETAANARLMAAAPEMLQTLEDVLQGLADGEDDLDLGLQIRNAIRKARGQV